MTVHGDFSREMTGTSSGNTSATHRWAGVLYQQGRVFMDADGNAQTAIATGWQDTAARDAFGPGVAAVPANAATSFHVETATLDGNGVVLEVQPGHAWADGMLVHLDGDGLQKIVAKYLQPPVQDPAETPATIGAGIRDAVILEVWREAINAFQIPDDLIEPALGGVDTTQRLSTAKALRLYRMADGDTCESITNQLADDASRLGKLTISLEPDTTIPGDCPVVEGGGYSGFLHSLGRIEIARSDNAAPRFKWSLFNGGLVGRATFDAATQRATILANVTAITSVDLVSFYLEALRFDPATLRWDVVYGAEVTLDEAGFVLPATPETGAIPGGNPVFIRLWNGIGNVGDFPAGSSPAALIDGIQLGFDAPASALYRPGDFWTFNVRAGDVPQTGALPVNAPPQGIEYHRVPLAVLEWDGSGNLASSTGTIEDCRRIFHPLTQLGGCCTFSVGDGIQSHGDFDSIQAAVDHLPAEGGQICVLPGTYHENVEIVRRRNVTISGCDHRSIVISRETRDTPPPVFHVVNSPSVEIRGLAIRAHEEGIGILLEDTVFADAGRGKDVGPSGLLAHQHLHDLFIRAAARPAIEVRGGVDVTIRDCLIEMFDVRSGWPALFFQGEDGLIEGNVIRVRPANREADTQETGRMLMHLSQLLQHRREVLSAGEPIVAGANLGGIQIGGLSERVRIVDNLIQGGIGNGITLGSVRVVTIDGADTGVRLGWIINLRDPCNPCKPGSVIVVDPNPEDAGGDVVYIPAGPLREIAIEKNRILDMGMNGIGVVGFFAENQWASRRQMVNRRRVVTVEGLRIVENDISRCLWRSLDQIPEDAIDAAGYGGISLGSVQDVRIAGNTIENNGPDYLDPVCGIFILIGIEVDIRNNRIVNNGAPTEAPSYRARPGRRGGINIMIAAAPDTEDLKLGGFSFQGRAALRLHDNIVSVPLGQALTVNAYGPVSVQGNSFSSKGIVSRPQQSRNPIYGATVTINCLSAGPDREPYSGSVASKAWRRLLDQFEDSAIGFAVRPRQMPSGFVQFSGNQCQFVPFPVRPSVVELEVAPQLTHHGSGVSGAITKVSEPILSRLSAAARTRITAILAQPVTSFAAISQPAPLPIASVSIISLDDIAISDNQCLTSIDAGTIVTQVFALGYSVRMLGNRFREGPENTRFSAISLAGMNITAHNTASHCLLILPRDNPPQSGYAVDGPNMYPMDFNAMGCARYDRLLSVRRGYRPPGDMVIDPVLGHLDATLLTTLDEARYTLLAGTAALLDLRQAHIDTLSNEMEIRRGADPQSPRLVTLQRRLDHDALIVRDLDRHVIRIATPVPQAEPDVWILSGRVMAERDEVPSGARLHMQDAQDQPLPGFESARIDRAGFFTARVPVAEKRALEIAKEGVTVIVATARGRELARHESTFAPVAGNVDYLEVAMGEDVRRPPVAPPAEPVADPAPNAEAPTTTRSRTRRKDPE